MIRGLLSLVGLETDNSGADDGLTTHRTDEPKINNIPVDLQASFVHGVKQNIKIVLRGERKVGKTALMHRLQGKLIPATYAPSQAISVTTIRWQVADEEATKVEVWDVVDAGSISQSKVGCSTSEKELRLAHPHVASLTQLPTDASTVNVYRNCNAAIFMIDVTRRETLDYVVREVKKVPPSVPVCVLANFFDQPNHAISKEMLAQLQASIVPAMTPFVRSITASAHFHRAAGSSASIIGERGDELMLSTTGGMSPSCAPCAPATIIELSLATGYGMSVLHNYLSIPFSFAKALQAEEGLQASFACLQRVYQTVNGLCCEQSFAKYLVNLRQREAEVARKALAADAGATVLDARRGVDSEEGDEEGEEEDEAASSSSAGEKDSRTAAGVGGRRRGEKHRRRPVSEQKSGRLYDLALAVPLSANHVIQVVRPSPHLSNGHAPHAAPTSSDASQVQLQTVPRPLEDGRRSPLERGKVAGVVVDRCFLGAVNDTSADALNHFFGALDAADERCEAAGALRGSDERHPEKPRVLRQLLQPRRL